MIVLTLQREEKMTWSKIIETYLTSTNGQHIQLMTTYNNSHCQAHLLADLITIPLMYNLKLWNNFHKRKLHFYLVLCIFRMLKCGVFFFKYFSKINKIKEYKAGFVGRGVDFIKPKCQNLYLKMPKYLRCFHSSIS